MFTTLPNLLTLLRILAVPVFAIAVWYGRNLEACMIFAAAGITDMADGYIARRFNQKSTLGAVLDPAADKLLMTTAFVLLALPMEHFAARVPAWLAILAISRDVSISLVALMSSGHFEPEKFRPSRLGKLTTGAELLAISLVLLFNAMGARVWYRSVLPGLYFVVAGMVLASGIHYFYRTASQRGEAC